MSDKEVKAPVAPAQQQSADPAQQQKAQRSTGAISDDAWDSAKSEFITQHLRNSPVAQETNSWNHFNAVIDHFRAILEKHL